MGECYWQELCELVDAGEISVSIARRIADDLFEGDPSVAPVLKTRIWRSCVENSLALEEIEALRRSDRHG